MGTWEKLALGAIALILIFMFFPGIKTTLERSKDAPKDWKGLLIPVALVVLFVLFLVSTVKA